MREGSGPVSTGPFAVSLLAVNAHDRKGKLTARTAVISAVRKRQLCAPGELSRDQYRAKMNELRAAVAHVAGRAKLQASGGVTLPTLQEVARTGVDFISVGAITHSAPALDLSLLMEPLP